MAFDACHYCPTYEFDACQYEFQMTVKKEYVHGPDGNSYYLISAGDKHWRYIPYDLGTYPVYDEEPIKEPVESVEPVEPVLMPIPSLTGELPRRLSF
jgi:hypothetical protein